MDNDNKVEFTFGWLALKLLGKSLYSNAWSAISELVANGFDAQAKNVYIYINIHDKNNAKIELFDDGNGMTHQAMQVYAKVGHNKRLDLKANGKSSRTDIMGRKGIGKLAALYLSESYCILTKAGSDESKWKMNYEENKLDENTKPFLIEVKSNISVDCQSKWNSIENGTLIKLDKVNLSGLGEEAFKALKNKLSNYFSLDSMDGKGIYLCIKKNSDGEIKFEKLEKLIAFGNMAYIAYSEKNPGKINEKIEQYNSHSLAIPFRDNDLEECYTHKTELINFSEIPSPKGIKDSDKYKPIGKYKGKQYILNGWIGIHESIKSSRAIKNDSNFLKNQFYNPIQLRLYVRNKLAIENFINIINNNQTFINYIEGEINFDILDDDDLPDIATSNRQGIDEHDERVIILKDLVSNIVQNLINKRNDLASKIKKEKERIKKDRATSAKINFGRELDSELSKITEISSQQKNDLTIIITNKIQGDLSPKEKYIVFFSHSSHNRKITDFLYYTLLEKGVKESEIFYTSKENDMDKYERKDSLRKQIKENIINENALIFYLTSKDYLESEFCLFEGGAGWATRSVSDYILLSTEYEHIPKLLTNGKFEYILSKNGQIQLDRETYSIIIVILNKLIDHLNQGRFVQSNKKIESFENPNIPFDHKLYKIGKSIEDYMDKTVLRLWNFYVNGKKM